MLNESDTATNFPGTTSTSTVQGATPYWQSGPQTFSLEAWVEDATTTGGKIIGFGDSRTGRSGTNGNDRNLYMNNSGQIYFGVRPDMGTRVTINSPSTYRDNQWHHVVGTLGADGMKLYVDGNLVASNANVKKAQVYRGYWRVGGDHLVVVAVARRPAKPSRPTSTRSRSTRRHSRSATSGRTTSRADARRCSRTSPRPRRSPRSSHYLTATFDGIARATTTARSRRTRGTSVTAPPAPARRRSTPTRPRGTYNVTLTVTDNRGGTGTHDGRRDGRRPAAEHPAGRVVHVERQLSHGDVHVDVDRRGRHDRVVLRGTSVTAPPAPARRRNTPTRRPAPTRSRSRSPTTAATPPRSRRLGDHHRPVRGRHVRAHRRQRPRHRRQRRALDALRRGVELRGHNGVGRITGASTANRVGVPARRLQQTDVDVKATDVARLRADRWRRLRVAHRSTGLERQRLPAEAALPCRTARSIAYLVRTVGNVETILATPRVPGLTVSPGDQLADRFVVTGTTTTTLQRQGLAQGHAWNRPRGS